MNFFYLVAGVITTVTGVMHGRWGEKVIVPELERSKMLELAKAGFHITWHQITCMLLITGNCLIALAFINLSREYETIVVLIVVLLLSNVGVFLFVSAKKYPEVLRSTYYPIFNSLVIIVFTLLGWLLTS